MDRRKGRVAAGDPVIDHDRDDAVGRVRVDLGAEHDLVQRGRIVGLGGRAEQGHADHARRGGIDRGADADGQSPVHGQGVARLLVGQSHRGREHVGAVGIGDAGIRIRNRHRGSGVGERRRVVEARARGIEVEHRRSIDIGGALYGDGDRVGRAVRRIDGEGIGRRLTVVQRLDGGIRVVQGVGPCAVGIELVAAPKALMPTPCWNVEGLSMSETVRVPVAVGVPKMLLLRPPSSVTSPVSSPAMTAASLAPLMVMLTVLAVLSIE